MAATHKDFDINFRRLYLDELPSFIDSLKSIENLPDSLRDSITTVEQNIEQNKILLTPLVEGRLAGIGDIVGCGMAAALSGGIPGVAGGIFGILSKKKNIKKLSGKRLVAIQDNTTHFSDTIQRMKLMLGKHKDSKPDYKQLAPQQQQELLSLVEEMKTLSEELSTELAT